MPADAAEIVRLAERIEQATGPDRELDARIWCALRGYRYKDHFEAYGTSLTQVEYTRPPMRRREVTTGIADRPHAAQYTASLDAAMALVDGVGVLLGLSDIGADGLPLARVGIPHLPDAPVFTGIASCIMTKTAPVAGLALALTAAALKARARLAQHDHEVG